VPSNIEGVILIHHELEALAGVNFRTIFMNEGLRHFQLATMQVNRVTEPGYIGGAFYDYQNLYYLLEGEIKFRLINSQNLEPEDHELSEGDLILIPEKVPYGAYIEKSAFYIHFRNLLTEGKRNPYIINWR